MRWSRSSGEAYGVVGVDFKFWFVTVGGFCKRVMNLGLWKLDCALSLLDLGGNGGVFPVLTKICG